MSSKNVLLEEINGVAWITLHRPDRGNAIDQGLADELVEIVDRCASDDAIRCVVLTGAGRMFCVGGDIGAFGNNSDDVGGFLSHLAGTLHRAMLCLSEMPKPLVVLVNGAAAGAGMSLAAAGDIVLAGSSASFTTAYGAIGLTPDGGLTWTLPRVVGLRRAQELMITNRRIDADEAFGIGLVTRVVPDADLVAEGERIAARLAQGAVRAMGTTRALIHAGMLCDFASQLDREVESIAAAGQGEEGSEGIEAFLAKRKPNFFGGSEDG